MTVRNLLLAGSALLGLALSLSAQQPQRPQQQKPLRVIPIELVRKRQEWFYGQRAYPLGYIPAGARLKALKQLDEMLKAQRRATLQPSAGASASAASIAASTTAWTPIGPQPTLPMPNNQFTGYPTDAGRVTALAVDPRDPSGNTIYLGAAEGGLWKTADGGTTWTPLTDFQPSLAVGSIALDPSANPTAIYIGTGEENHSDSYYGAGVLKSTDGGTTWTQDVTFSQPGVASPTASGPYIGALAVDPANSQILLAAVEHTASVTGGIWRSTDGGNSWALALSASGDGTDVVFDLASPGTAYAASSTLGTNPLNNRAYKSTDAGATWTKLADPTCLFCTPGRITLAIGPPRFLGSPGELFAAIADASAGSKNLLGLFASYDGGQSWSQLTSTPNFCAGQCFYDMVVRVSPVSPLAIFAGGNNAQGATLIASTDGGATWSGDLNAGTSSGSGQLHTDTHALAFRPDGAALYVGNDGGVWSSFVPNFSSATGFNWSDLNTTLNITQFYPGHSIFPGNPNLGAGGTQDNGTQGYTGALQWQQFDCGDGGYTAINPAQPAALLYDACAAKEGISEFSLTPSSPFASAALVSNTPQCSALAGTLVCDDPQDFVPPLVMDPENPNTLYFGTFRVWQTVNGHVGPTDWLLLASQPSLSAGDMITTIAVAPTDSTTIYVGTSFGVVQATSSQGLAWNPPSTGLPNRSVTQIAVDPSAPMTAFVSFSGFSSCSACDHMGHIFQTANGGMNWTSMTGNLPDIPVNDVVVDPDVFATLYAATDIGAFITTDAGTTWSPLLSGLPRVAVLGLKLDRQSRILRAATHGRGMWDLQLPQPPTTSFSPPSLSFGNLNVGSTSAAQSLALMNTGGSPLAISGIATTAPFGESNNCGTALAQGASCTITVTFTASAVGSFMGTLSVSDNLRTSPQTVALTGTGQDFSVAVSPNSASVARGGTATYTVTVSPVGSSFTNPVTFSCSGFPPLSLCSFWPNPLTPGSSTGTATFTVSTTASSVGLRMPAAPWPKGSRYAIWLGLLPAILVAAMLGKKRENTKLSLCLIVIGLFAFLTLQVACGGGGGQSFAPSRPGTPSGTFPITITGTSGSLQHSTNVTLTVQ